MPKEEDWPAIATAQRLRIAAVENERDEARTLARLYYHWALWHDDVMAQAFCVETIEELLALNEITEAEYEEWRFLREGGLRHRHPWLMVAPEEEGCP